MDHFSFVTLAIFFLICLAIISANILSRFIGKGKKANYWKVLWLNILALFCVCTYGLESYYPLLSELLVRFGIMYFAFVGVATLLAALALLLTSLYTKIAGKETVVDPSRRTLLRRMIFLPAAGFALYGGLREADHIEYNEITVHTDNKKLQTVVMAQISDVHLGLFFSVAKLKMVLNNCLQSGANMLVMTGDIFDSDRLNEEAILLVDKYVPLFPYGIYFVWGNHEHMRNMEAIKKALATTKIKVLTNESVALFKGDAPVYILGVDYVESKAPVSPRRILYLKDAMKNIPAKAYKILLAHHPAYIDDGFREKIDLILTGHTHGGQVRIFNQPVLPIFKYMAGSYYNNGNLGFVSRGTGSWFPFRFGCSPEVVIFKFTK